MVDLPAVEQLPVVALSELLAVHYFAVVPLWKVNLFYHMTALSGYYNALPHASVKVRICTCLLINIHLLVL